MKVVVVDDFERNALKDMENLLQEELNIKDICLKNALLLKN